MPDGAVPLLVPGCLVHTDCMCTWQVSRAWEMAAREYAAAAISTALARLAASGSRQQLPAGNVTCADVIAVSAMEGVGLAQAVEQYNSVLPGTARPVAHAYVRAMSDWLHQPVAKVCGPAFKLDSLPTFHS
jgi:hypothetical protein